MLEFSFYYLITYHVLVTMGLGDTVQYLIHCAHLLSTYGVIYPEPYMIFTHIFENSQFMINALSGLYLIVRYYYAWFPHM